MKIVEEHIPQLIRAQQDKEVILHLYKKVFPTVQNYIKKNKGIADDANDVFQDALMYFYKQVVNKTYNEKYTVYGYLYRLAINRWVNKLNKDKKMVFNNDINDDFERDITYQKIGETQDENRAGNALKQFSVYIGERCEELLSLRIYSELMFEDIALRMDFSTEAAAKMFFKRCREKLVDVIKKNPALAKQLRQHE